MSARLARLVAALGMTPHRRQDQMPPKVDAVAAERRRIAQAFEVLVTERMKAVVLCAQAMDGDRGIEDDQLRRAVQKMASDGQSALADMRLLVTTMRSQQCGP